MYGKVYIVTPSRTPEEDTIVGQDHDDKRSIEELSKMPSEIRETIENIDEDEMIERLEKDLITTAKLDKERLDKAYKEQNERHKSLLRKSNEEL